MGDERREVGVGLSFGALDVVVLALSEYFAVPTAGVAAR